MANHTIVLTRRSALIGAVFAALLACPPVSLAGEQQTFAAPEEAVAAMLSAVCKIDDDAAMLALFGESHKRLVVSPDKSEQTARRTKTCAELKAFHALEVAGADRRILLMGAEAWPMPIPLVREKGAWRFATELGEDELLTRWIGANERNAIVVLRAYLDAQRQYASVDRNGDGVLEYAQKLGSSPGRQDGLYWPADAAKGEEPSPFGPLVAASSERFKGRGAGDPYQGYHFRILTRQGENAPGGAFSYLINGRMLAGFAMIAYPADYGTSGVMTFLINNSGVIYEKNLGPQTASTAAQIKTFNPNATWKKLDSF